MFSTSDIMAKFKVEKLTVSNWRRTGKIKARQYKIGKRTYYGYSIDQINEIELRIKPRKEWKSGQSLLYTDEELANKKKKKR